MLTVSGLQLALCILFAILICRNAVTVLWLRINRLNCVVRYYLHEIESIQLITKSYSL